MAHTKVYMFHPYTGENITVPIGFSWTTLFFGFIPALLRSDLKWAIIQLIIAMLSIGIFWFIFPFFYNGIYYRECQKAGFIEVPEDNVITREY